MQNRFSQRVGAQIRQTQAAGTTAKSKKNRQPKDFERLAIEARHQAVEGWYGIPAGAIRAACISACRVVGFHMTKAKLSVFVDGRIRCGGRHPARAHHQRGTALLRARGPQ